MGYRMIIVFAQTKGGVGKSILSLIADHDPASEPALILPDSL